jgi:hypothetical protein
LAVFIVYILSRIVDKFFFGQLLLTVDQHTHLALFGPDHHGLIPHAADHVKRVHRPAPQGQLEGVVLHTLFQCAFQVIGDLKEPIGRTKSADTLMRSLVIVVFDPVRTARHRLLKAAKLGAHKKLRLDAFPETLDFAQGHGMMGAGADVAHAVLFHLPLKPRFPTPVGVLPAVVGEHLPGNTVLGNPPAVGLYHLGRGLAAIQPQTGDVAGIIVYKADQIGITPRQAEGHDITLP